MQRGSDLRYTLDLALEDAVFGVEKTIRVPRLTECDTCNGSGAKPGSWPKTCQTCNGQGQVRMQQGFFAIQQTCPRCHGQGKVVTDPCGDCRGQGRKEETKTLSVKFLQELIRVTAFACLVRVKRVSTVAQRVISMCK